MAPCIKKHQWVVCNKDPSGYEGDLPENEIVESSIQIDHGYVCNKDFTQIVIFCRQKSNHNFDKFQYNVYNKASTHGSVSICELLHVGVKKHLDNVYNKAVANVSRVRT